MSPVWIDLGTVPYLAPAGQRGVFPAGDIHAAWSMHYNCAMTEAFVELFDRGVRLCTARAGEGPALLIISGSGSDIRNQPTIFQNPIAAHFDTMMYDHRGLGRSEQSDPDYQPSMADFAEDALALVDSQGIDRFAVVGVSFGGMVAQELAIRAGDRVNKLVLCCTSSGGPGGSSYPLHELYARGQTLDDIFGLRDIRCQYDRAIAEQVLAGLSGRFDKSYAATPGLLKQIEARRHHDTFSRLAQISAPTLVAHGVYDAIAEPENSAALAAAIPSATLAPFIGGHGFLAQDVTAWPRIAKFLGVR